MIGILLLLACCQATEATVGGDVIHLELGEDLVGRICRETVDYVEIELGGGAVVGLAKSRVRAIVRGAAAVVPASARLSRDRWYSLHDGGGVAVGWLHAMATVDGEVVRHSEEWRIRDGDLTTDLTMLEVVRLGGAPVSAFYHERTHGLDAERCDSERVVRAEVVGDQLAVTVRSMRGVDRREYSVGSGLRFPLELRREVMANPETEQLEESFRVFDPRREQFHLLEFAGSRSRRIPSGVGSRRVRVMNVDDGIVCNAIWFDGPNAILRREVNGPALVAVRGTETAAKSFGRGSSVGIEPAFQAERGGRFGMWLPNPMWQFNEDEPAGQISAGMGMYAAGVSLVLVDQLDAGVGIESAADVVVRWLRLVHPELELRSREAVVVRNTRGVRIKARFARQQRDHVSRTIRCDAVVFHVDGDLLALCCEAPLRDYPLVQRDFDRILESLELRPEGVRPVARGTASARIRKP